MEYMASWIPAKELINRWHTGPRSIVEAVEKGLPVYEEQCIDCRWEMVQVDLSAVTKHYSQMGKNAFQTAYFKSDDVIKFEMENAMQTDQRLPAKEARELGQLRREKEKWDDSLKAALIAGIRLGQLGRKIKKADFTDSILSMDLPMSTIDKIWNSIPSEFKNQAGRPKK